jgi:hypothetical protein
LKPFVSKDTPLPSFYEESESLTSQYEEERRTTKIQKIIDEGGFPTGFELGSYTIPEFCHQT